MTEKKQYTNILMLIGNHSNKKTALKEHYCISQTIGLSIFRCTAELQNFIVCFLQITGLSSTILDKLKIDKELSD